MDLWRFLFDVFMGYILSGNILPCSYQVLLNILSGYEILTSLSILYHTLNRITFSFPSSFIFGRTYHKRTKKTDVHWSKFWKIYLKKRSIWHKKNHMTTKILQPNYTYCSASFSPYFMNLWICFDKEPLRSVAIHCKKRSVNSQLFNSMHLLKAESCKCQVLLAGGRWTSLNRN